MISPGQLRASANTSASRARRLAQSTRAVHGHVRINVPNPIVDLDGDEMTRVIWRKIKDQLIHPYLNVDIKYYDLGLANRDKTEDQVTQEAVKAIATHRVAIKCPTISVDYKRMQEYRLRKGTTNLIKPSCYIHLETD